MIRIDSIARRCLLAGFALALLVSGGAAVGQGAPTADAFQPDFREGDLDLFSRELGLDANRKVVLEALLVDYGTAFGEGVRQARARLAAVQPPPDPEAEARAREEFTKKTKELLAEAKRQVEEADGDPETRREIMETYRNRVLALQEELDRPAAAGGADDAAATASAQILQAWAAERARLREELLINIQAILSPEQLALWPRVIRAWRRDRTLPFGQLSGESVDLFRVVHEVKADASPEAAESLHRLLDEYAEGLDAALIARNLVLEGAEATGDPAARVAREVALRTAVRDVNVAYIETITGALPPEVAPRFLEAARRAAFPRVFRPTPVQRLLEAGRRRAGDDAKLADLLVGLEREYEAELDQRNEGLFALVLAGEPDELRARLLHQTLPADSDASAAVKALNEAFDARRQLDRSFIMRVQHVLSAGSAEPVPGMRRPESRSKGT